MGTITGNPQNSTGGGVQVNQGLDGFFEIYIPIGIRGATLRTGFSLPRSTWDQLVEVIKKGDVT